MFATGTKALYEALDYLNDLPFANIEAALSKQWARLAPADTKCFVLDVTDTYFAGSRTEAKPTKGKDGKVSRLLQIGPVVSFQNGFPLLHKSCARNISTFKIFPDLLALIAAPGLSAIVLDRGKQPTSKRKRRESWVETKSECADKLKIKYPARRGFERKACRRILLPA